MRSILLIDDDPNQHKILSFYLRENYGSDCLFDSAFNLEDALLHLGRKPFDVIFLDNRLAPYRNYRETIERIRTASGDSIVYLISAAREDEKLGDYQAFGISDVIDKFDLRLAISGGLLN